MTIRTTMSAAALLLAGALHAENRQVTTDEVAIPKPPVIVKMGTIDLDLCETTPFVFKGKLYRLEWHRRAERLRIREHDTNREISHFGERHRFPCAIVKDDTVYVYGTKKEPYWYTGYSLTLFTSKDLTNWTEQTVFDNRGKPDTGLDVPKDSKLSWGFCNTSVCPAGDRYVMSIDRATNPPNYRGRFLESKDLINWTELSPEHQFSLGRYCAPHCLRWHNGWFYVFYLEAGRPRGYEQYITRSRDLIHWSPSPFNPVVAASPEDKLIANPKLDEAQREKIARARDANNSDVDMCEIDGKTLFVYSWGNQMGIEFIAEAEYAGTLAQFLEAWFPDEQLWGGIDITQRLSTFAKNRRDYGRVVSATGATVTVSSGNTNDIEQLITGTGPRPFAFSTNREANPHVTIDLGREAALTGILIRNRTDCCQERAENLRVRVSRDKQSWEEISKADAIEPVWEIPLLDKNIKARYVRLETHPKKPTPFHLKHVEIWGKPAP